MTIHRRHAAERRIAVVLLACLGLAGMPRATVAQPGETGTENRASPDPSGASASLPVTLEIAAPGPVAATLRDFLRRHLDLPAVAAGDESGRAALSRRASRDVVALLATEGYFSPRVRARPAPADGLPVIEIDPGTRTVVDSVEIVFSGALAGSDGALADRRTALRTDWRLPSGEPFRSADWENAKRLLLAAVAAEDHAAARIADSVAEVDPATARARLRVVLDSGPAFRFGPVEIQGLSRYERSLVDRLQPFRPGDPYRRDQLLDFQSRLQATPYFHSVMVTVDPSPEAATELPVRVSLIEARARQIGIGIGYSTNSGARSELNYRNRDFLGSAWNLSSGLRLEQKRQSLFADVETQPDARGYRAAFGGRTERSDIQGLASTRQALAAARSRIEGHIETRLGLEWQRDHQRPDSGSERTDRALVLDWRWIRRSVDDSLDPRSGGVIELRLGGAAQRLLSDRDFVHGHLRIQHWWPFGERDTLTLRAEAGLTAATSRRGIPQDYLFRAGGTQSVRGYAYQSLGVREGAAIVGGRALATGSIEYTHWLDGDWGAAAFIDAGSAADRWQDLSPALGYGLGARWRTPAGPLALDLARGHDSGRWQLHFSIAVAF